MQRRAEETAQSDVSSCEGMYGDDALLDKALEDRHILFSEAAQLALDAGGVRELWLTHFSPSMPQPKQFLDAARALFRHTRCPRDGWKKSLCFDDE